MSLSRLQALRESQAAIVKDETTESADNLQAEIKRLQGLLASGALSQLQANSIRDAIPHLQRVHNLVSVAAADGVEEPKALPAPPVLRLRERARAAISA